MNRRFICIISRGEVFKLRGTMMKKRKMFKILVVQVSMSQGVGTQDLRNSRLYVRLE